MSPLNEPSIVECYMSLHAEDYYDLHKYSVEDYTFWLDLWEYLGIISSIPPQKACSLELERLIRFGVEQAFLQDRILEQGKLLQEIPNWFPGARLNYAENLLIRKDDGTALTEANESGVIAHVSYRELNARVREMAAALRINGLNVGDRVAGKWHLVSLIQLLTPL
jgi:acetoacetyl-CoA synthetase